MAAILNVGIRGCKGLRHALTMRPYHQTLITRKKWCNLINFANISSTDVEHCGIISLLEAAMLCNRASISATLCQQNNVHVACGRVLVTSFLGHEVFFGYYNRPAISRLRLTLTLRCDREHRCSRAAGKVITLLPCCIEINYPAGFFCVTAVKTALPKKALVIKKLE